MGRPAPTAPITTLAKAPPRARTGARAWSHRNGDAIGQGHSARGNVGHNHRFSIGIDARGIVRTCGTGIGGATIEQGIRLGGLDNGPCQGGANRKKRQCDNCRSGSFQHETKLLMLHCNNSNYFVTRSAKHYINQPIKERDRDRTAKFGEKFR